MSIFDGGLFMTPQEIYSKITGGPGSQRLNLAQALTLTEREQETYRAHQIDKLSKTLDAGWQGDAGWAALSAAVPLRETSLEGSAQLERAQDLLSRQSESFHTVANEVRPISEEPPANPMGEVIPFETDIDKEVQAYQSDAQHNMNVYRGYDNASQYNETHMPEDYSTTNRSIAGASVKPPPDTIEVGEPGPGGPGPGRSDGPGDYSGFTSEPYPGGSGPGGPPPGGPHPGGPLPGGPAGPGDQTSPNEWRPPTTTPPGQYYNPNYPAVGQPSPVSAAPGSFTPGGGYPGGPGGGRGPGSGSGTTGGPGAGRGYGPSPGVGAGALAAEEAAARRAAQAATGRPGSGPMGAPTGGGRNKDDEDTEHERKFLIEADAEDTFGSDVLTAPQVIGDDEYEE